MDAKKYTFKMGDRKTLINATPLSESAPNNVEAALLIEKICKLESEIQVKVNELAELHKQLKGEE